MLHTHHIFLFPKLTNSIKGIHFQPVEDICKKMVEFLKAFSKMSSGDASKPGRLIYGNM
jgi:hypothetical protein